jgi:hypothetical protein
MMFEDLLLVLMVIALALGYGACAALFVRNHRVADTLLVSALGLAGSMLLASLGSAWPSRTMTRRPEAETCRKGVASASAVLAREVRLTKMAGSSSPAIVSFRRCIPPQA